MEFTIRHPRVVYYKTKRVDLAPKASSLRFKILSQDGLLKFVKNNSN